MVQKSIDSFYERSTANNDGRKTKKRRETSKGQDLSTLQEALKMYKEIGHVEGEVDTLIEISLFHIRKSALLKALDPAEKARDKAEDLLDERESNALLLIGDIRFAVDDRENAEESWNSVLESKGTVTSQALSMYLRLAYLSASSMESDPDHEDDNLDSASGYFRKNIEKAEEISETPEAAFLMGRFHELQLDHINAERWYKKSLSRIGNAVRPVLYAEVPVIPEVSDREIYHSLGRVREQQGRFTEAATAYERADDYMAQGRVLESLGNLEQSLEAMKNGLKRTGEIGYILTIATAYMKLGNTEDALTTLIKGEKDLFKAMKKENRREYIEALDLELDILNSGNDIEKITGTLEKKGEACEFLEEYEAMADSYRKASGFLVGSDDEKAWKRAVGSMKKVIDSASRRNRPELELDYRLELEEMHIRNSRDPTNVYSDNVKFCYQLKRPLLIIEFFRKEIQLHKGKEENYLDYLHLARANHSAGRKREAIAVYQEAIKHYSDSNRRGIIFREMGFLYRRSGDHDNAIKVLEKAHGQFSKARDTEGMVRSLTESEKVYDDLTVRENMERSKIISQKNKILAQREKLTEENNNYQKIIRETTKIIEGMKKEISRKKETLNTLRDEASGKSGEKKKYAEKIEKLRLSITKQEEKCDSLNSVIRENMSQKINAQDEKARLKNELAEMKKLDAKFKKKVHVLEMKAQEFRSRAMGVDPMLATSAKLETIEEDIYDHLSGGEIPRVRIPTRTKDNIEFSDRERVFRYGSGLSFRSAKSTDGANMLMRTAYVIDFIDDMIRSTLKGKNRSSTLRELYYISESWGKLAKFGTQNESNNLIEDLEIVTRYLRENFHLRPEEDGARVIGNITLREKNRKGEWKTINCREDVGDSGYTIPYNVDKEKIQFKDVDADFVMAIETGGMFDRLVENGFDEDSRAVLVHIKGQPARSTRRFIKRLNEETRLPVLVFTDGDPWSYRIFASIAYGAIKTAHISHHLATPSAEYVGITPSDILTYDLPTDKLNDRDMDALKSELTDPRFSDSFWQDEISTQLRIKKKSEQQALAKYGLDFVTDTYLPEKLGEMGYVR